MVHAMGHPRYPRCGLCDRATGCGCDLLAPLYLFPRDLTFLYAVDGRDLHSCNSSAKVSIFLGIKAVSQQKLFLLHSAVHNFCCSCPTDDYLRPLRIHILQIIPATDTARRGAESALANSSSSLYYCD